MFLAEFCLCHATIDHYKKNKTNNSVRTTQLNREHVYNTGKVPEKSKSKMTNYQITLTLYSVVTSIKLSETGYS